MANRKQQVKVKPTKANFIVHVDVYKCDIMFSFGETYDEVLHRLLKTDIPCRQIGAAEWDYGNAYVYRFDGGSQLARFRALPQGASSFGTLAHEIFHVACGIMYGKDMTEINSGNEEVVAYLIDCITRNCYELLNKYL